MSALLAVAPHSNPGDLERCGANALAVCCRRLGDAVSVDELDRLAGNRREHTTLLNLHSAARARGFEAIGLRWTEGLPGPWLARAPAVAPLVARNRQPHFVAVVGARDADLLVVDFPRGPSWIPAEELGERWRWDGTLLHIVRDPQLAGDLRAVGASARFPWKRILFMTIAAIALGVLSAVLARRFRIASPPRVRASSPARSGFSLLELVVAMGIISVLLGLLLPAVLAARAQARRMACLNNLRQVGVALESFESAHGRYPPGSVSAASATGQHVSDNMAPHVALLPYLDQSPLYDKFDRSESGWGVNDEPPVSRGNAELMSVSLGVFQCPDDPAGLPRNSYRISCGTSPGMHETKPPDQPGAALQGYRSLLGRFDAQFKDGKSHTTAFAEKLAGDRDPEAFSPWRDSVNVRTLQPLTFPDDALRACSQPADPDPPHASFGGSTWVLSGYTQTWYNHVLTPNSRIPDCAAGRPGGLGAYTARSLHSGGVNVLFADGSTRFVSENIDLGVWRAVGTVNGGEPVGDF